MSHHEYRKLEVFGLIVGISWLMGSAQSFAKEAEKKPTGKVLATVNQKTITDQDLMRAVSGLPLAQRIAILKDIKLRRDVLQQIIDHEILIQEGVKLKVDEEPDFKFQMDTLRKEALAERALEKKLAGYLTPKDVKNYYESHKEEFSPDRVHVQHILVDNENLAKEVLKQAKEPSADFQELVKKYSKDPTKENNSGDVGWVNRGGMIDPQFTAAAFAGKVGTVVGPVHTTFGYHIINIVEKKFGKPFEYDEVEAQVQAVLRQRLSRNVVENLRAHAQIKIDGDAIDKL